MKKVVLMKKVVSYIQVKEFPSARAAAEYLIEKEGYGAYSKEILAGKLSQTKRKDAHIDALWKIRDVKEKK